MNIHVELSEQDIREMVLAKLQDLTNLPINLEDIKVEVKSKQNYKSEWEEASFRASVRKTRNI